MNRKQTEGREANGAVPGGRPDEGTPDEAIERTGRREVRSAGPDGPDAKSIGDTFKRFPAEATSR